MSDGSKRLEMYCSCEKFFVRSAVKNKMPAKLKAGESRKTYAESMCPK